MQRIRRMGSLTSLLGMMPGLGRLADQVDSEEMDGPHPSGGGDHPLDDAGRAAKSARPERVAAAAYRQRQRHSGARCQPVAQAISANEEDDGPTRWRARWRKIVTALAPRRPAAIAGPARRLVAAPIVDQGVRIRW